MPDRSYSDEEFALILQRASELQDRSDVGAPQLPGPTGGGPTPTGMSLETIRDIAQEVGLEPRFIDRAAAAIARDVTVGKPGLLGGPLSHHLGDTFARSLTDGERTELLDVIRGVLRHEGVTNEVMGSLEWKTVGRMDQLTVTITSSDERVAVRVVSDASGLAALTWVGSIVTGLVVGGIVVSALQPASLLVAASILAAGGTAGVGVARAIWSATTGAFRRRAERLREEITRYLSP